MPRHDREQGFEDVDEGQRPRFSLPGVREVGPQDVRDDEAAAFGAVGAGVKMRAMIEHHRRIFPAADRALMRRYWDEPRSEILMDNLDELGGALGIDNLEGASVRGKGQRSRIIVLVTRGKTPDGSPGRVHKSWLPYSVLDADDETLGPIKTACERAARVAEAREKGAVLGLPSAGDNADLDEIRAELRELRGRSSAEPDPEVAELREELAELREQLAVRELRGRSSAEPDPEVAELREELAELREQLAERERADADDDDAEPDLLPTTLPEIKAAIDAAPEDDREALKARIREAEQVRSRPRQGVLEATEPASD